MPRVSFTTSKGRVVSFQAKKKRKSACKTLAQLNKKLQPLPPALQANARKQWKKAHSKKH